MNLSDIIDKNAHQTSDQFKCVHQWPISVFKVLDRAFVGLGGGMFGRPSEGGAIKSHRSSAASRQDIEQDALFAAAERKELAAQKFDEWVRFKDSFDRGLVLFAKLDSRHCEGDEAWQKVAVILAAIDRSLGIDLHVAIRNVKQDGSTKAKAGPQSMFDAFKKWSLFGHTFTFVKLTGAEVESLGAATRQFLEPDGNGDGTETPTVLPSLKYHFPPPPARRGLRTRPMTDDQKAMNAIFVRRVRAGWVAANREMREQLAKYVEEAETSYQIKRRQALGLKDPTVGDADGVPSSPRKQRAGSEESKDESKTETGEGKEESLDRGEKKENGESKHEEGIEDGRESAAEEGEALSSGSGIKPEEPLRETTLFELGRYGKVGAGEDEGMQARRTRFMDAGLVAVGIRRLNELLEDDIDTRKKKENDDRLEREEDARRAHEGWIRVKDTRRFRIPDEEAFRPGGVWKPPRFDFSGGKGLVRPNKNLIASTTLDIMRGQGMKYAHAISDARQGVEGDLEKSKRQIKRYKETIVHERTVRAAVRKADKVEAFRGWSRLKAVTEAAVRCLRDIDAPARTADKRARERWLEVGRALKSVDARLLSDWTAWTGGSFPPAHCQAVWDALKPRSCDTHSTSYSATRETFLKLLRPGVDYREAFHKVVRKRLRKAWGDRGGRFDENEELQPEDLVLNRRELRHLLTRELGILMRGEEMRRLADAFGTNADRLVRWEDFEKLTGGVREAVRGDAAKRLEKRCVWETTCPDTGMPNAYVVSAVKEDEKGGGPGTRPDGSGSDDDRHDGDDVQGGRSAGEAMAAGTTTSAWGGTSEIITLKSGDRRRRNELADRSRRLRILGKYGLASDAANESRGNRKKRAQPGRGGDYDDDEFEGEDDGDDPYGEDDFEKSEGGGGGRRSPGRERSGGAVPCEASEWPLSKRNKGLQTLKRLGKANREASELRQLLAEGTVPKPPQFWSAKPNHPDVCQGEEEDEGNGDVALIDELLLCWRPQPGSAVAFFSLEMSGPEGGKAFCQGSYREICRDPPDADGEPQYQVWVRGLCPNTRYAFRLRAFNGFGSGAYVHGCFATRPFKPAAPVAVKLSPSEVTLQWVFRSRDSAIELCELRRVFDTLCGEKNHFHNNDDDGGEGRGDWVGRDEFLGTLDLHHPHLMAHLKATALASPTTSAGGVGGHHCKGRRRRRARRARVVGPETLSVFDVIEANEDGVLCWDEIEIHYSHAMGGPDSTTDGGGVGGGSGGRFAVEVCLSQEDDRWKEVWKGTAGTARVKMLKAGCCYRFRVRPANCEGVEGPASESVVVNTLLPTPGAPRIKAASGKTTAAAGATTGVWDTRVRLRWDAVVGGGGGAASTPVGGGGVIDGGKDGVETKADRTTAKIMMQWAHERSDDQGVGVEAVFSQFSRDVRGAIDPLELGNLLEALGVEVTEERLREAFTELDRGGGGGGIDGTLSFDNFEEWWASDQAAKFVLMRDDGVAGSLLEMAAAGAVTACGGSSSNGGDSGSIITSGTSPTRAPTSTAVAGATGAVATRSAAMTIASFKGSANGCEVAGLSPNTMYRFRVRAVNNRTRSALSAPLEVMTSPRRPEAPVIVRCEQRSVVIKWYPGSSGGAYKYRLQARLVEGLDGIGAVPHNPGGAYGVATGGVRGFGKKKGRPAWGGAGDAGDGAGEEWVTVYEGVDTSAKVTGLATNSVHHFRVCSLNLQSVASEWSLPAQGATAPRQAAGGAGAGAGGGGWDDRVGSLLSRPQNAAEVFHVDADDDIVVGDTIIFTERLYVDRDGDLVAPGGTITTNTITANNVPGSYQSPRAFQHHRHAFPASSTGVVPGVSAPRVSLSMASLGCDAAVAGNNRCGGGRVGRYAATTAGTSRAAREAGGGKRPSTTSAALGPRSSWSSGSGDFVGERTAAAHVLQDSFRSMRRKERRGVLEYNRTNNRGRLLRLEVIWSTVSRDEARDFLLQRGSIVERSQERLSQFETFRSLWVQDERRKSIREEWALLSGLC